MPKIIRDIMLGTALFTLGPGIFASGYYTLQSTKQKAYEEGKQAGRQTEIQYEAELIERQLGLDCGSRQPNEYSPLRILAWYPPRAEEPDKSILKDEDKSTGNLELRILCDGPSTPRYPGSPDYTTLKLSVPLKDLRVKWLESIWDTQDKE